MILENRIRSLLQPILNHLSFSLPTNRGHEKVRIPILGGTGLGVYKQFRSGEENWKLGAFKQLLKLSDGLFVDVGANLGQTLIQLRQVDRERPYLGFEPNPDCLHYLYQLILTNAYANVELLAAGLGETTGVLTLHLPPGRSTDSIATLIKNLRPGREYDTRHVPIFDEDHLAGLIGKRKIGVVKIDVEGAELEVLKGIRTIIGRDRPAVLCEVLYTDRDGNLDNNAARNQQLMSLLESIDYYVFQIQKSGDAQRIYGLKLLEKFPMDYHGLENMNLADYLFLPKEHAEKWAGSLLPATEETCKAVPTIK